jgi:hypothetical protein
MLHLRALLSPVIVTLATAGCVGGGSGSDRPTSSSPSAGVFVGVVRDGGGAPVAGARVSVDGIEASALTGADGVFVVSDPSLATGSAASPAQAGAYAAAASAPGPQFAVLAPGYEAYVAALAVGEGDVPELDLVRSGLAPDLVVVSPPGTRTVVVPAGCASPSVPVEGSVDLGPREGFRLDVAIVIDRSGSTGRTAFDVDGDGQADTVLDAEVAAARCFVRGLDWRTTRASVIAFHDDALTLQSFTSDPALVEAALDAIGAPIHGTNYEAAFAAAESAFEQAALDDAAAAALEGEPEPGAAAPPPPLRAVVFLTDGIPTSHGIPRDTTDSNLTQSAADRHAAIDAATALGAGTGARLFGYSIIPAQDPDRPRTTLPHCVAACGGGRYANVADIAALEAELCGEPLVSLVSVEVQNVTAGGAAIAPALAAGGRFSTLVPLALTGTPDAAGIYENEIEVRATAFSGALARTASRTLRVRLVPAGTYAALAPDAAAGAQAAPASVAASGGFEKPEGGTVTRGSLLDFLSTDFPDAVQLFGVERLTAAAPLASPPTATVTLAVDFVFHQSCMKSDVGFIEIDPAHPPATAAEALIATPADKVHVLFNSGVLDTDPACSPKAIPPGGAAHFEVPVAAGTEVAFFVIPNRTLAAYQAHPAAGRDPLFTIAALDPGGFAHHVAFRSAAGRAASGAAPGPVTVIALEEVYIPQSRSTEDFNDIVIAVGEEAATIDAAECR